MSGARAAGGRGRWRRLADRALRGLVALVLLALMMVTVVDVVGRDLFDRPLRGGYELSGLMLMVLFYIALPGATAGGHHIAVSLIDRAAPARLRAGLALARDLLGAAVMIALALFVLRSGLAAARYQETTLLLRLPVAPFRVLAALSLGLAGLVFAWSAVTGRRA